MRHTQRHYATTEALRVARCALPHHPAGVDRRETFSSDADRQTYLGLLQQNLPESGVRVPGWCLMTNHVHLIAVPATEDSLSVLLRRIHGRYAQYYYASARRTGHLWQNRFFACVLRRIIFGGRSRMSSATRCARESWRAPGITAGPARPPTSPVTMKAASWTGIGGDSNRTPIGIPFLDGLPNQPDELLRACTHAGRPFGSQDFLRQMADQFDRHWTRGRPKKKPPARPPTDSTEQLSLF